MKKTVLSQVLVLLVLLMFSPNGFYAQEHQLIPNSDFQQGYSGFYSDYSYVSGEVGEGQFCIDVNTSGHAGGLGWEPVQGYGGSGDKFMMVNGDGSNNTEKVWATGTPSQPQPVSVTTNTYYRLSFKVANQNQYPGISTKAKLLVKINGNTVGPNNGYQVQGNNAWHNWPSDNEYYFRWNSGSNTQALIEIWDICNSGSGLGDDFCLDNISFVPESWYYVDVHSDAYQNLLCLNQSVDINVLDNDEISGSFDIEISQQPSHGTCSILSNNYIRYVYDDENNDGSTDSFKYRVTIQGHTGSGTTDETTVYITNLGLSLEIDEIQAPENPICEGYPLGIPTPSVTPNVTGHWEYSSSQGGPWSELTNPNSIGLELNNKYIHYTASNDCGSSSSNAVQIHVSSLPTISLSPQTVDPICEGPNLVFELPTFTLGNNGYNAPILPGGQGWRIADNPNGPFNEPFTNTNITYNNHNGRYICYYAENVCGPNYSDPIQLVVNAAPIVPNIQAPAGICEGGSFNLTTPQPINWRDNNAPSNTHEFGWEIFNEVEGGWIPLVNNNIPFEYNGYHIRYMAHNICDYGYSNEVTVTVYSTQPIVLPDVTFCQAGYYHGVWCSQDGQVYGYDSITPNNCTIHVSWTFHLSEDYNTHPQMETRCDEYYWPQTGITYYASGIYTDTVPNPNPVECDDVYILDLTVNHAPEITGQLISPNPVEVCASVGTLNVNEPEFNPNHDDYNTDWEVFYDGAWHDGFHPESFNLGYGSYSLRFVVDNDCVDQPVYSNSVPFYVSEEPVISIVSGQMPDSVCEGSPLDLPEIAVDWKNMSQSGIVSRWEISENGNSWVELPDLTMPIEHDWWIRYYAQNSCGGASLEPVRVSVIEVEDETVYYEPECDSIMCLFDEVYYYESTVVDEVIDYPCPHIRHHNLVVNHSDRPETNPELIEVIVWCKDEYVWHGRTYYRSEQLQVDQWSTTNIWGCDSIRELRLSFGDANEIYNNNQHGCDSYIWEVNDTISIPYYYDENEPHVLDTVFIPGEGEACDTYYYLDLVMGKTWEAWESPCDTIAICKGEEYNGVPYYTDVIIYDTLQAVVNECDSIVSRYLSIIQPSDTVVEIESCNQVWWQCQGQEHLFYEDGEEFTAHLTSQLTGCDSIVTLRFSLTDNIEKIESTTVCEPFVLPDGQLVNQSGPWTYIIPSPDDCDTTVYLNVTFVQTDTLVEAQNACNSYLFHDVTYGPGYYEIYHDPVSLPNGCISEIQLLKLTVKDSEQLGTISGPSNVYVASSLISGIYRYEIDSEGINSPVIWSLSNPDWQILEPGDNFCQVLVTMPGSAILKAHFNVEECGEMERFFEINASFYGVDDIQNEVRIFPNPTKGSVTVEAEGIESLRLTDMMGQVLEMRECKHSDSVILNLGGYTPSVYLLEIKTVYGIAKKRIVLCR